MSEKPQDVRDHGPPGSVRPAARPDPAASTAPQGQSLLPHQPRGRVVPGAEALPTARDRASTLKTETEGQVDNVSESKQLECRLLTAATSIIA